MKLTEALAEWSDAITDAYMFDLRDDEFVQEVIEARQRALKVRPLLIALVAQGEAAIEECNAVRDGFIDDHLRGSTAEVKSLYDIAREAVRELENGGEDDWSQLSDADIRRFTPALRSVVKLSNEEAVSANSCSIGVNHLLVAIAREGTTLPAKFIRDHLNIGIDKLRDYANSLNNLDMPVIDIYKKAVQLAGHYKSDCPVDVHHLFTVLLKDNSTKQNEACGYRWNSCIAGTMLSEYRQFVYFN